uniref:Uncharacterized protein n=1 Tax=Utricularia reniformis TaxID=192314 RepID=A0A1Y0B445_9LAMI|nr:hypothetical protein AEK19_MT2010 [Utricularia reniformis]ART32170.1 hypothetical protein AEK19_MT2010 [Utricularia reniformis]
MVVAASAAVTGTLERGSKTLQRLERGGEIDL